MSMVLALWSHALAAAVFATLMLWQLRGGAHGAGQRLLLAGLLLTSMWAWLGAVQAGGALTAHAETARNLVWIALLHALSAGGEEEQSHSAGLRLVYGAVAAVLGMQFIVDALPLWMADPGGKIAATSHILRITGAAGALVLVHQVASHTASTNRNSVRLALGALAIGWSYDLTLYSAAYFDIGLAEGLFRWRGAVLVASAPLFAFGGQDAAGWRLRLSRAATFQSLSLLAICSYFALVAVLATAMRGTDWNWTRGLTIVLLALMTVAVMVLLPSARARSWTKVKIAKHLFEHRYDYRAEWLRFTATLGAAGRDAPPLAERVISGFAEIVDSPSGMLIAAEDHGAPVLAATWNWAGRTPSAPQLDEVAAGMWSALASGRVIEFDAHRRGTGDARDQAVPMPPWLAEEKALWAGIPLIHNARLVGLVLLSAPDVRRALDWEDFDLLRTAGVQAASSLAEAHGQQALMNAQRFEEFNRRFAFILHDIKNLVSQLSLLTRNAERHADNPEFRADMVATLKSSVGKMNDLLARLAPQGGAGSQPRAQPFALLAVLAAAVAAKRRSHEVRLIGAAAVEVLGNAAALEQAVGHLLQNAVDASAADAPVTVRVTEDKARVAIEIADSGCGMDSDFVRNRLFQPFASTKSGGFGIGAFEARSLIVAMGGQLSVASRPDHGTRFTIHLPVAPAVTNYDHHDDATFERKRA